MFILVQPARFTKPSWRAVCLIKMSFFESIGSSYCNVSCGVYFTIMQFILREREENVSANAINIDLKDVTKLVDRRYLYRELFSSKKRARSPCA